MPSYYAIHKLANEKSRVIRQLRRQIWICSIAAISVTTAFASSFAGERAKPCSNAGEFRIFEAPSGAHASCPSRTRQRRARKIARTKQPTVMASAVAAKERIDCLGSFDVDVRIRACTDLIRRNPNDAGAYNSRASAYASKGDYTSALADAEKGGDLEKRATKPRLALGKRIVSSPSKNAPPTYQNTLPDWAQTLFQKHGD